MNVSTDRSKPLDEHAAGGRSWLGALSALSAIVATVALALYQYVPPAVVPADAPKTEFSAERAMAHLEVIAPEPHPVGSPENARVRDYLIRQISDMGLRPEVQKTTVFPPDPDEADATRVKNVLVRIDGTAPTSRTVLITAHYDSVVTGPGAGTMG
jgi:acetylornithine deacetylase/succinyl-diaminopimelate desuccinylase-like protein